MLLYSIELITAIKIYVKSFCPEFTCFGKIEKQVLKVIQSNGGCS